MSDSRRETLIRQYLDRVAEQLRDLPSEERSEILGDLRSHIEEAIGDPASASEAEVRNVLQRLGHPVDFARDARERAADEPTPGAPVYRRVNKSPGALEVIAIVMTAVFWPIGIILAWLSPRWLTRDKVIATVIPIFSFLLIIALLVPARVGYEATNTMVSEPQMVQPAPGHQPEAPEVIDARTQSGSEGIGIAIARFAIVLLFLVGGIGGPFISAIYLAIRLQPHEEHFYPDGTRFSSGMPAGAG